VHTYINRFECGGGVQMINAGLHTLCRFHPCIHIGVYMHMRMRRRTTLENTREKEVACLDRARESWYCIVSPGNAMHGRTRGRVGHQPSSVQPNGCYVIVMG
jgi:hypothetical protein